MLAQRIITFLAIIVPLAVLGYLFRGPLGRVFNIGDRAADPVVLSNRIVASPSPTVIAVASPSPSAAPTATPKSLATAGAAKLPKTGAGDVSLALGSAATVISAIVMERRRRA